MVKNLPANVGHAGDLSLVPGWGRSPRVGNGNSLQYSCLKNPMDRGAWWAIVHGVVKSQTRLSTQHGTHTHICIIHVIKTIICILHMLYKHKHCIIYWNIIKLFSFYSCIYIELFPNIRAFLFAVWYGSLMAESKEEQKSLLMKVK